VREREKREGMLYPVHSRWAGLADSRFSRRGCKLSLEEFWKKTMKVVLFMKKGKEVIAVAFDINEDYIKANGLFS
jgi:hypothetical protein